MLKKDFWKNSCENIRKLVGRVKVICSRKKLVINSNEKNIRYKDLGPKDISKEDSEYFNALDWAFNNEKIGIRVYRNRDLGSGIERNGIFPEDKSMFPGRLPPKRKNRGASVSFWLLEPV